VEEEMYVGVDEAGHEGGVAEVDDDGTGGMRDQGAACADAVADDKDFAGRENLAGLDVKDAGGMQDGGVGIQNLGVGWRRERGDEKRSSGEGADVHRARRILHRRGDVAYPEED